jgi:hypothetical protein
MIQNELQSNQIVHQQFSNKNELSNLHRKELTTYFINNEKIAFSFTKL